MDIEEDETDNKRVSKIVITSHDGTTMNNGHTTNKQNVNNMISTDSEDDDLSYFTDNDGRRTPKTPATPNTHQNNNSLEVNTKTISSISAKQTDTDYDSNNNNKYNGGNTPTMELDIDLEDDGSD